MTQEVSGDIIQKTQKSLGKYVKKPPLTEKLLKKPPFRFLHDVITTTIKETGFLKGLYSDYELVSDNVKDKDAKVAFLNKLIEAIKSLSDNNLSVRASKIVAGLEPTNTNLLLQALAKSLDSKIDSTQYVSNLKTGVKTDKIKKSKIPVEKFKGTSRTNEQKVAEKKPIKSNDKKETNKKIPNSVRTDDSNKGKTRKNSKQEEKAPKMHKTGESPKIDSSKKETPKEESTKKEKSKIIDSARNASNKVKDSARNESITSSEKKDEPEENNTNKQREDDGPNLEQSKDLEDTPKLGNHLTLNEGLNTTITNEINKETDNVEDKNIAIVDVNSNRNLPRPKSARPKSGDLDKNKTTTKEYVQTQNEPSKMLEATDSAPPKPVPSLRPKSSLRPPSVRPSSARPGAPRLRIDSALPMQEAVPMGTINVIVENVDASAADEEETVVIETVSVDPEGPTEIPQVDLDNKGHLVEQILEQIEEKNVENKKKTGIDWDNNALRNKDYTTKDITPLLDYIQTLTKTANPLGKLINFLHEDIEAMHSELQLWINTKKQLYVEIVKQKKSSVELNKPLLAQLEQLNRDIKKNQQEITNINCNILKNDTRIKELLCK
ncbi:TRAF3-interacting protein 1 [Diabrotica virgifera virgifera]|uniref:TRAF3-interacting protein 1 n=1 Tax=Diabrotica virgifera virgifera TaxID=50390 RepID=A0A6P7FXZ0_DIAVI|nr:TRAF3-interacting protein 1 [Diabrotica virgifera virgifera]